MRFKNVPLLTFMLTSLFAMPVFADSFAIDRNGQTYICTAQGNSDTGCSNSVRYTTTADYDFCQAHFSSGVYRCIRNETKTCRDASTGRTWVETNSYTTNFCGDMAGSGESDVQRICAGS